MSRVFLSAPDMGGDEQALVEEAFRTNWLSSLGPHVSAFEDELAARMGAPTCALSSGTAALHLGLHVLGVRPGDEVICSTLTFVASVNPVLYLGARPIFVDSERASWNMDPQALEDALVRCDRRGKRPRAIVVVHLYGQSADLDPILEIAARYEVPVVEDAAEALGTTYRGRQVGALGALGVLSFNGNKIITTTSGGALVSRDPALVDDARFLSTQARDPDIAYSHSRMGFNYRMSNVLAGIGRGQLRVLDTRVAQRRAIAFRYRDAFADLEGLELMPQAPYGQHTNWLSCFTVDEAALGVGRDALLEALAAEEIEARPVWKPMHLQALFDGCEVVGGAVADDLFRRGICLPSSSFLDQPTQQRVVDCVRAAAGARKTG